MHRLIMGFPVNMEVDHINGDTLDNRRCNLRICTHAENMANRKIHRDNTSGYRGVYWSKERNMWRVQIYINGKKIDRYDKTLKGAALKYNELALKYRGKDARINIII